MTEEQQINLFKLLERSLFKSNPALSLVRLVIYYHMEWINFDYRNLPVTLVVHIYPQDQSEPLDIDFYQQLSDRLTLHFNIFSIEDMEFVHSTNPFPFDEIPPLENRIFQVVAKRCNSEYLYLNQLNF